MTVITDLLQKGDTLKGQKGIKYVISDEQPHQGNFGVLYKAFVDNKPNKVVAIKELRPMSLTLNGVDCDSPEKTSNSTKEMFDNEGALLEFLRPAIPDYSPSYHERFDFNGLTYLVMDFIEGMDLKSWLAKQPGEKLSVQQTASLLAPLANVLCVMHSWSCFHGDISPKNVMVQEINQQDEVDSAHKKYNLRFIDFGLGACLVPGKTLPEVFYGGTSGYKDPMIHKPNFDQGVSNKDKLNRLKADFLARDFYAFIATSYFLVMGKDPDPSQLDLTGIDEPMRQFFEKYLGNNHTTLFDAKQSDEMERFMSALSMEKIVFSQCFEYQVSTNSAVGSDGDHVEESTEDKSTGEPNLTPSNNSKDNVDDEFVPENSESDKQMPEEETVKEIDTECADTKENESLEESETTNAPISISESSDVSGAKEDIPVKEEQDPFSRFLKQLASHKFEIAVLVAAVLIVVVYSLQHKHNTDQSGMTFPSSASEQPVEPIQPTPATSESDVLTQHFADFYDGKFTGAEMLEFFTEDAYFLVQTGDVFEGTRADPLYSVRQLLNNKFTPTYQIGADYKVVDIERDSPSTPIRRIVIKKQ